MTVNAFALVVALLVFALGCCLSYWLGYAKGFQVGWKLNLIKTAGNLITNFREIFQ